MECSATSETSISQPLPKAQEPWAKRDREILRARSQRGLKGGGSQRGLKLCCLKMTGPLYSELTAVSVTYIRPA